MHKGRSAVYNSMTCIYLLYLHILALHILVAKHLYKMHVIIKYFDVLTIELENCSCYSPISWKHDELGYCWQSQYRWRYDLWSPCCTAPVGKAPSSDHCLCQPRLLTYPRTHIVRSFNDNMRKRIQSHLQQGAQYLIWEKPSYLIDLFIASRQRILKWKS